MNPISIHLASPPIVRADGFFDWANGITDKSLLLLQGAIVVIGIVIFVAGAVIGKGRMASIVLSVVAGGLFIWGGIAGVFWVRDQAKATVESSSSIVEVYPYESALALPELPVDEL